MQWKGRYKRIPGDTSVFRVIRHRGEWVILACIKNADETIICQALSSPAEQELISAINCIKQRYGYHNGGSFLINEFGQVLVPINPTLRFCAGQINGILLFKNLDTGIITNLADDQGLEPGDFWDRPYVGMWYNLSRKNELYYWDHNKDEAVKPPVQDKQLIRRLRSLRRGTGIRIVANPFGLVLAKVPVGEFDFDQEQWQPVYVGRIDYTKWFKKEEPEWQVSS